MRGPARKGLTPPLRARRDTPTPATPSNGNNSPPLTLLPLPRLCPGHCRGCAMSRATAFPAQPTHTHTGGKRAGVPEVPLSVTTTPSLSLLCALEDEESVSRGCLGPSLGWFSPGAMGLFRGHSSVIMFCVGLPGKGSQQCRERGGTPLIPTTPQTTTTLASPPLTLSIFPVCAPGVEAGAQHAAPLPPPDPTCTHTMGESGSELLGTRHPAPPSRFSQICPLL